MSNIPANFTDGTFSITDDNSNSATLVMSQGDLSFSGLVPDGREAIVSQSRGGTVGIRKGARAYPTISVSAILAAPSAAFQVLALGKTAGFQSTTSLIEPAMICFMGVVVGFIAMSIILPVFKLPSIMTQK